MANDRAVVILITSPFTTDHHEPLSDLLRRLSEAIDDHQRRYANPPTTEPQQRELPL